MSHSGPPLTSQSPPPIYNAHATATTAAATARATFPPARIALLAAPVADGDAMDVSVAMVPEGAVTDGETVSAVGVTEGALGVTVGAEDGTDTTLLTEAEADLDRRE